MDFALHHHLFTLQFALHNCSINVLITTLNLECLINSSYLLPFESHLKGNSLSKFVSYKYELNILGLLLKTII